MKHRQGVAAAVMAVTGLLWGAGVSPAQAIDEPTDVSVSKTASPVGPVLGGDQITYTITVTNLSPENFTREITLTDAIPAGTTFVSLTGTFPYSWGEILQPNPPCTTPAQGGTGTVTCVGLLEAARFLDYEATFTLVVQVDANAQGPITNTATATLANDPNLTNNTATVVTNVSPTQEVRPGKGCGDKNHIHEREAECEKAAK